jgi:oligosaccharyltransferase complex subunit epsilon
MSELLSSSWKTIVLNYKSTTPGRVKLIDCFLAFLIVSGVTQFAHRLLITSDPYNAFSGGQALSDSVWH